MAISPDGKFWARLTATFKRLNDPNPGTASAALNGLVAHLQTAGVDIRDVKLSLVSQRDRSLMAQHRAEISDLTEVHEAALAALNDTIAKLNDQVAALRVELEVATTPPVDPLQADLEAWLDAKLCLAMVEQVPTSEILAALGLPVDTHHARRLAKMMVQIAHWRETPNIRSGSTHVRGYRYRPYC